MYDASKNTMVTETFSFLLRNIKKAVDSNALRNRTRYLFDNYDRKKYNWSKIILYIVLRI